jgi:hypothetical protein
MRCTDIRLDFLIKDPIYCYFELSDLEKEIINSNLEGDGGDVHKIIRIFKECWWGRTYPK